MTLKRSASSYVKTDEIISVQILKSACTYLSIGSFLYAEVHLLSQPTSVALVNDLEGPERAGWSPEVNGLVPPHQRSRPSTWGMHPLRDAPAHTGSHSDICTCPYVHAHTCLPLSMKHCLHPTLPGWPHLISPPPQDVFTSV